MDEAIQPKCPKKSPGSLDDYKSKYFSKGRKTISGAISRMLWAMIGWLNAEWRQQEKPSSKQELSTNTANEDAMSFDYKRLLVIKTKI